MHRDLPLFYGGVLFTVEEYKFFHLDFIFIRIFFNSSLKLLILFYHHYFLDGYDDDVGVDVHDVNDDVVDDNDDDCCGYNTLFSPFSSEMNNLIS